MLILKEVGTGNGFREYGKFQGKIRFEKRQHGKCW
jgi:hypothetical protein